MRAKVLVGFCLAPMVNVVPGQIVDMPDGMFREMAARGSVEPAPEPTPAEAPIPEAGASKSKSK